MTDVIAARILDAAILSLRAEILPQLQDDAARIRFDQITRLLRAASARLSSREDGLRDFIQSSDRTLAPNADLERQRREIEQAFSQQLPTLLAAARQSDEAIRELERIIELEKRFFIALDADVATGSGVVYRGGRIDKERASVRASEFPPLDESTLTAYVRAHFGRADLQACNLRTIPGGFSKQTLFFTLRNTTDGSAQDLVIRKDMSMPFIEKTVANEFGLLQRLHALGFSVARPLWLENDHARFGGRFMVSERVAGSSDVSRWAKDPMRAKAACRELARVLAQLHAFSPQQLGYPAELAERSAGELMEREIAHWTALFHAKKTEPLPLQELPLVWLARNVPKALYARPAKVVHGDVGFHNLMFDDRGQVTALLDWEFCVLGDPTQDLCFVRPFVQNILDWREFIELYRSCGGVEPCHEAEFFFELWTKTRNSVGCVDAQRLFDTAMPDEVKFALAGHIFAPYLYIDQCESLLARLKQTRV